MHVRGAMGLITYTQKGNMLQTAVELVELNARSVFDGFCFITHKGAHHYIYVSPSLGRSNVPSYDQDGKKKLSG